jgi:ABC-type lipoprotein export system ATPase subunit
MLTSLAIGLAVGLILALTGAGGGILAVTLLIDGCGHAHFGEMLYIVGPSGSGKITLLSIISGILRPDEGTVTINGTDIWTLDEDALAEFRLRTIGFVFQDYHLFPRLSAAENVALPLIRARWTRRCDTWTWSACASARRCRRSS